MASKHHSVDIQHLGEHLLALEQSRQQFESRSEVKVMKAYLVSLERQEDEPQEIQESLEELGALVRTLGDECVGVTVQKKSKPIPSTFIGPGKAEELTKVFLTLAVDYVVFDQELSPSQIKNLEQLIKKPILDRTGVILQIFKRNARSKEARTQVEIAHIEYMAPRLSNAWIDWERQRGSGGSGGRVKGAGETQIEIDRRRLKDRVASLKKDLEKIKKERDVHKKHRENEWNVALVGYTNAGKTTLMNALTESHLSAKNSLFETLDSSVRRLKNVGNMNILLTDTVGFIRNLPHGLVASFRSTLEEATKADLLLHVVDVSHHSYKDHMKITEQVLSEIGTSHVPSLIVFNKIDAIENEPRLPKILGKIYPKSICISSQKEEDILRLKTAIIDFLSKDMVTKNFYVHYNDARLLSFIYNKTRVLQSQWEEDGMGLFSVRISQACLEQYHSLFDPHPLEP